MPGSWFFHHEHEADDCSDYREWNSDIELKRWGKLKSLSGNQDRSGET
jgi:hypothetical protein